MKTLEQVKKEKQELMVFLSESKSSGEKLKSKDKKRLEFLQMVILYLERNPEKAYLEKELKRVSELKEQLESRFEEWLKNTPNPKQKTRSVRVRQFEKESGVALLSKQRSTIKYILE